MKLFKKIKHTKEEIGKNKCQYIFTPFERGIATTLGNSLRRALLSSLSSYAITAIKVKGAPHEFTSLDNVLEDLPNIILNLKKIAFNVNDELFSDGSDNIDLKLKSKNGAVLAKHIECPTGVNIVNEDLYLASTDTDGALVIDMVLEKNRGFESFSLNNDKVTLKEGYIGIDSIYSPVINATFKVEELNTHKNFVEERLILTIETNGSISPDDALEQASKILIAHFQVFLINTDINVAEKKLISEADEQKTAHYYNWPIEHLNLNIRTYNSLKRGNINVIKEILSKSKSDLECMKNFGDKAFADLIQALKAKKIDASKFE